MLGINTTFNLDNSREVMIETGKLAKQADGSAVVKMGNTMLLATVVANKEPRENVDFLPLSVEYREKYAAAGRFPGGFFKREARPSEYEILISRLVDRALRPLFPDDFHAEIQVLITLISSDTNVMPDALACLAASSAIAVSDIPFNGPISEVRVARINNELVINPGISDIPNADIDLIIAASMDNIVMVEGEMKEVQESDMIEALSFAHEAIKKQCKAQLDLVDKLDNLKEKREYEHEVNDNELAEQVRKATYDKIYSAAKSNKAKHDRSDAFEAILNQFLETIPEDELEEKEPLVKRYFHDVEKDAVRNLVLNETIRLDGRKPDEIRPIWTEVDYLPTAHGSAIFTRGETQSLTTVTLGTKLDEQVIDGVVIEDKIDFILHYNFPPFSTGEAKPLRGTSRREVGHGNLALMSLKNMLPEEADNPYTIRIVSDILESNGSSSMATVCAGTLALMDAGVKMKKPVSGIAMGLIMDEESQKYAVLSDILGDEDHLGDMDFKVTGTKDGITACQMDIKVKGLSFDILAQALEQAKQGRIHILNEMTKTIMEPREDYKPHVPRIVQMTVPKEYIGAIIGPGGKIIQDLQNETNSTIVVEEVGDLGIIDIVSNNKESIDQVKERIKQIIAVPEIGEIYKGKVKNIAPFGAFIEILPGKEGLLHISEIEWKRISNVEEVLNVGDEVEVKLIDIDRKSGKFKLSRKALLPKPEDGRNRDRR